MYGCVIIEADTHNSLDYFVLSDIDECTDGTHNCDVNAFCSNNNGSFTCTCNSGYDGDGVTCSTGMQL